MAHGKPILQVAHPDAATAAGDTAGTPSTEREIDNRLIDAALAGDRSAFGQLVERHQDRLVNALVRFTGSPEDAHDIAQDALVQALTKLDRFRRDSAFFTWLYRIAFNRAVSVSRKRRERVSLDGLREDGGVEPNSTGPRPEEHTLGCERVELVHQALATLAEDHRQVLVLREFDGLDYQQIAEIVEVPVGTVRSRLFRARSQLREALEPHGFDETNG
ncbi:MAG: sigma-70 family RNA polymerase sigma factor [Planctomycetota bacterium]